MEEITPSENDEKSKEIIKRFVIRAYRGRASKEEYENLCIYYDQMIQQGCDRLEALRMTLVTILVSPRFLFINQPPTEGGRNPQLAERLSYFYVELKSDFEDDQAFDFPRTKPKDSGRRGFTG